MTTSAVLSPGIKSLHLSLDTPVDPITGKVRRDLSGIRVWYSTQSGFNPLNSQGTLAFNGLSLDITISNLLENTQYYVKYAFVSSIDPSVYTVSQQLSALTYDENTTVYGNLTNPSSIIPTNAAGTDGNYTVAGGVFKVYKYSTEVTGTGVVYAIQSGTAVGGLVATLDPTTGAYAVTALTADYGSVILSATYDNVTVLTTLSVTKARAGIDGTNAQLLTINAEGTAFVFKDAAASTSDTTKLTLIANLKNVTGTVTWTATAFNVNNVSLGAIAFTQTGNSIDITAQQFNPVAYNNTVAYVTVTASRVLLTDTVTLYRINNGTDQIVVEFTNESHTIPAYYDGTTVPASYMGSGTEIRVKQGNQYLTVDNTVPYATGTWTVTAANGVDITPDTTPGIFSGYINYDTHSNMTQDRAYIDYTITGTSLTGAPFSIGRRQSFAKSVAGEPGATATLVRLTTTELVFIKFKDGTFSSNSVTIYANPQNIPDPIFLWDDGINTPVPQDGSIDPEASQFEFTRPSELGVYTITVSVSDKFNTMLTQATDSISIAFIEEGSDAYTFLFKEPSNQLSANSLGIIEGGVTSNTNHIIGAQGIRLLVPGTVAVPGNDIVYTIDSTENCTAVLGSVTGTWNQQFTVSGAFFTNPSITSAKVTIKCQVPGPGGLAYYMTTSYIKVRKGDTGAAGASAIFADLLSEADVVTTLSDGTGYTLPTGNALRLYSGGSVVTTGVTYGGTITKNGLTLTIDNTGAITLSGAAWTNDQQLFNVTATLGGIAYTAVYTIAKSRAGSDAVFVDLLSEAEVVVTTSTGTGYTLPTGNSMRVFKGGTQVTSGVAYSGTTTKNGLTLTIDGSTGAITLSGAAWTTDKETFTLTATFGVAYTYTYKITKAKQGTTGATGAATATVALYAKNNGAGSPPAAFSGTFTYTFSTSVLSGGTLNGWSQTAPGVTNGEYLWVRYAVASSATATDTVESTEFSSAVISAVGGVNGTAGTNTATIELFAKNTSASTPPAAFSGIFTYTFSTSVLSGGTLNGWSRTAPAITNGEYLWARYAVAASNTATDTVDTSEFSAAVVRSIGGTNGAAGAAGNSVYVGTVYRVLATQPATPSGGSFNFTTNTLTAPTNWSSTQPATTTTPTYACDFTFSGAVNSTVTAGTWSTPYIEAVNGSNGNNGEYRDTIQLYLLSAPTPTQPTSLPYTFTGNTIGTQTGGTAGWSLTQPSPTTIPVYMTRALASTTTPGTAVTLTAWSTPVIVAQNGTNGNAGAAAPKTTSGYIYYAISGGDPGTPSASGFNFTTGAFTGLSANWGTTITMTGNGTYWASRYVVTESSAGSNTGTPSFSVAFTHQNFSGLVTFTTLDSYPSKFEIGNIDPYGQPYTTIHGGNVSAGTLSIDSIKNNSSKAVTGVQGGINTFGFGAGTVISGIATVGFFKTTDPGTLGLGVLSSANMAFAASTTYSGTAGGFGNRHGVGIDLLNSGYNRTLAAFASAFTGGTFQIRNQAGSVVENGILPDPNTLAYAKFAFTDDQSSYFGAQIKNQSSGYYMNIGTPTKSFYANGPAEVNGALSVGSLTVGGVAINTNGGGGIEASQAYTSPYSFTIRLIPNNELTSLYAGAPAGDGSFGFSGPAYETRLNYGGHGLWTTGSSYIQGQSFGASSRRYKDNILPIDIGLDFILGLTPVKFDTKNSGKSKVGFIAEDFTDPRFVLYMPIDMQDPTKGTQAEAIEYSTITAPLVKAVQELNEKIVQLTTELNALKNA